MNEETSSVSCVITDWTLTQPTVDGLELDVLFTLTQEQAREFLRMMGRLPASGVGSRATLSL